MKIATCLATAYPGHMSPLRLAGLLALACVSAFAEDVPTRMTTRGKELYQEAAAELKVEGFTADLSQAGAAEKLIAGLLAP